MLQLKKISPKFKQISADCGVYGLGGWGTDHTEGRMMKFPALNPLGYLGFLGALGCLGFLRYLPGAESMGRLHALFCLAFLFLLFVVPARRRE